MNQVGVARGLSLACYLGLIVFGMAWAIRLGGLPRNQISLTLLVLVAPLLIPLRGILHGRNRAMIWGSLAALIPLLHGAPSAGAQTGRPAAGAGWSSAWR
ncbi:DUF2069 domain-containing protein [endosymbiont of unidentified scaly snail isolate Monju]|uniref:DUF2069 domain-containing protein n=1 Tax=endosymbiont of unidentified scaly snail isolate Monju TaxID=1248727 RepID=UPI000389260D|nr:DUF2069 domain-containing protein [endosymbiont of unidentified scaly snail isolate Monju]BAN68690.1 hypothetical protein EBS_0741 [endosymbiont of unidentified scaly snail isolate Monju]